MPRAASNSSGPTLRRNQACRTCRKKKLKCDAARPHCGQCVKHWKGIISVPAPEGYAHPEEPQCTYDPIEGLTLADSINPGEKIRQLEEQIVVLKQRLQEAGIANSPTPSDFSSRARLSPAERRLSSLAPPSYTITSSPEPQIPRPDISLPRGGLDVASSLRSTSPASLSRSATSSPDMNGQGPESLLSLFAYGWNPDLPSPDEMRRIIDVFFACDPCGSRILHRPTFLASLDLSPKDHRFPHSSILHAICASASRWTTTDFFHTPDGIRRDTFADYHAGKTRQYIDRTMASGSDIFQVLQACIILSWYFYAEGRWVEGTFTTHGTGSPGAYLGPPKDQKDLEMRRRTWWMSIVFDRVVAVGGWLHGIEYKNIATELPLRRDDFEGDQSIASNPQSLHTENFYTTHLPHYTDSFLLFIKAVMLFGQVTDLNTELSFTLPSFSFDDPFRHPLFRNLDKLVGGDFLGSLPIEYKSYLYTTTPDSFDTDLYMVHLLPHAASITLHNPYVNFGDPQCLSTRRCINAANAILEAYYAFTKVVAFSSNHFAFPSLVSKLHPFVTICWYLAAVVKIQMCKYMIDSNQSNAEVEIWGEINAMRHALIEYGHLSPIGNRQEKLLKTLMDEIVRVTAQEKPLEIGGSRLYPFSHKSVFQDANVIGAPLPTSPPIEAFGSSGSPPLGMTGVPAHIQGQNASHNAQTSWHLSRSDMSQSQSPPSHPSALSSFMP